MLEVGKAYPKPEMSLIFGTKAKQGLDRKLERYGITFSVSGRGEQAVYKIQGICDPFKVFAITELGFDEEVFGLQLEYDVHKKGYRLLNPPFEPYELRLMVDGVQSSKFITKEKAREITGKIKKLAGNTVRESLNRQAYVADRVRSMNDSVVRDADRIHEAINKDLKIGLRYVKRCSVLITDD